MNTSDVAPGQVIPRAHMLVIDEYMKDCNQRQAMLRAGYSDTAASSRRSRHTIFGNPAVQQEIARRQNVTAEKAGVEKDDLVAKLKEIAFGELGKFIQIDHEGLLRWNFKGATEHELNRIDMLAVETYVEGRGENAQTVKKFKITKKDQLRAIDMLNRMLGFYDESLTLKGELTLVERLQAGRNRIKQPVIEAQVVDAN
jgi:phage terminase small subunit